MSAFNRVLIRRWSFTVPSSPAPGTEVKGVEDPYYRAKGVRVSNVVQRWMKLCFGWVSDRTQIGADDGQFIFPKSTIEVQVASKSVIILPTGRLCNTSGDLQHGVLTAAGEQPLGIPTGDGIVGGIPVPSEEASVDLYWRVNGGPPGFASGGEFAVYACYFEEQIKRDA